MRRYFKYALIFSFLTVLFLFTASFLFFNLVAEAGLSQVESRHIFDMDGYAWSDFIGWIDFQPESGGVEVGLDGSIEGYAWSEHIGWIDFNPSGPYPDNPDYSARVDMDGYLEECDENNICGWARAVAGGEYDDGWDGWIKMGPGAGYGVEIHSYIKDEIIDYGEVKLFTTFIVDEEKSISFEGPPSYDPYDIPGYNDGESPIIEIESNSVEKIEIEIEDEEEDELGLSFKGNLLLLGIADSVDAYFKYWYLDENDEPQKSFTDKKRIDSEGEFEIIVCCLSELKEQETYYFQAVGEPRLSGDSELRGSAWGANILGSIAFSCRNQNICDQYDYRVTTDFIPKRPTLDPEVINGDYCNQSRPVVFINFNYDSYFDVEAGEYDWRVVNRDTGETVIDPGSGVVGDGFMIEDELEFDTDYRLEIQATDKYGIRSEKYEKNFRTRIRYPVVSYDFSPPEPYADEVVEFMDRTEYHDWEDSENRDGEIILRWIFEDAHHPEKEGPRSQYETVKNELKKDGYLEVDLEVEARIRGETGDYILQTCNVEADSDRIINVIPELPDWEETGPF